MTHPTDEELDALVKRLRVDSPLCEEHFTANEAADAITSLRTQLADANARADRAEAERAAQIEVERVQHIKRGSTYRVLGRGKVQTDDNLTDYDEVVIYQGETDGLIWARTVKEFEDGRFTLLHAQPHDRTALDRILAEAEARGIKRAESLLLGLLKGEYSSLTIGFNDDHARNYVKAEGWRDEYGFYTGDDKDLIAWVSDDEREKAVADNSVWTLQWYPRTPVGFECLGASSLSAILAMIENKEQS